MKIDIHPLTDNPTRAWKELSKIQKVIKIKNVPSKIGPVSADKVRFVCMSDTHSLTSHIKFQIPDGDIFLHAGDFTKCGAEEEVIEFNNWLGQLPHKHKVVIAGNHELSFDKAFLEPQHRASRSIPTLGFERSQLDQACSNPDAKLNLTNCIYLEDQEITLYGIKIYGSPWQPRFCNWAFNAERGAECLSKWDAIPADTDVLLTHGPPLGHGDLCATGVRAGCVELLTSVQQRIKPKYHVFGHIHEGYGITSDGKIIYINAATCNINYLPEHLPIVFDVPLPPGVGKSDIP